MVKACLEQSHLEENRPTEFLQPNDVLCPCLHWFAKYKNRVSDWRKQPRVMNQRGLVR